MSVLYVIKYNIHPDKTEEFPKWAQSAIQRVLAVPGVMEFRAYRTAIEAIKSLPPLNLPIWLPLLPGRNTRIAKKLTQKLLPWA